MFIYRVMEEFNGKFTIMYRQNGWTSLFDSDFYSLYDAGTVKSPGRKLVVYDTLDEAISRINEEIRKDKYPIVVKEIK